MSLGLWCKCVSRARERIRSAQKEARGTCTQDVRNQESEAAHSCSQQGSEELSTAPCSLLVSWEAVALTAARKTHAKIVPKLHQSLLLLVSIGCAV